MSMELLICGYTFNASTAALQKKGRKESLTPSRNSKSALIRPRKAAMRVTSTSTTVVSWADVCNDSTMRSAMTRRSLLIFSVRPRSADGSAVAVAVAVAAEPESLLAPLVLLAVVVMVVPVALWCRPVPLRRREHRLCECGRQLRYR